MVNYDIHNGFSVSSIYLQSEEHFASNINHHNNHGNVDVRTINTTQNKNGLMSKSKKTFLVTPSISILTIKEVNYLHVGNYTCAPSNAKQASITVHVLRGKYTCHKFINIPTTTKNHIDLLHMANISFMSFLLCCCLLPHFSGFELFDLHF